MSVQQFPSSMLLWTIATTTLHHRPVNRRKMTKQDAALVWEKNALIQSYKPPSLHVRCNGARTNYLREGEKRQRPREREREREWIIEPEANKISPSNIGVVASIWTLVDFSFSVFSLNFIRFERTRWSDFSQMKTVDEEPCQVIRMRSETIRFSITNLIVDTLHVFYWVRDFERFHCERIMSNGEKKEDEDEEKRSDWIAHPSITSH